MRTFYFPIQSTSLAHYFGAAIIKPAKYFNNKQDDIQNKYEDFLLFTNKLGTKETDCCLEIVLTDEEIKDLIDVKGGWFLFDEKPLPISRVKKILFSNKEKRAIVITNITMSTAYIPEQLVEIRDFEDNSSDVICIPENCNGVNQKDKIVKYDRFLGALALMKTAGESYMNYSPNYISTLSLFNSKIKEQLNRVNNQTFKDNYQGIFTNSKGFEKVLPYLDKQIDEQLLNKFANEEKQEIRKDKITHIIDIEGINENTWTYTIAILNMYGVGNEARRKKIDREIYTHFSGIKKGKAEGVALCYGYNRGYSAFTKDYGIDEMVSYKYKLESQLDYYTIESVYQYVFNEVVSDCFPYLDEWCPKLSARLPQKSTDYVIFDEIIIGLKKAKAFSEDWWNSLFPRFHKEFGQLLSKTIFRFFQELCEEINKDIDEEKKDFIAIYQKELDDKNNRIDELTQKLNKKTEEAHITQQVTNNINNNISSDKIRLNLKEMSVQELKDMAKLKGIQIPKKFKKNDIIELLIQSNDLFSSTYN